jgi:hypothetical protein
MHRKLKWIAPGLVLLLILVGVGVWFATAESRRIAIEVQKRVAQMNDEFAPESRDAMNKIIALGDKAYPELRRILTWRETSATRFYRLIYSKLPSKLRAQIAPPDARIGLQHNLYQCVSAMGPTICRAMTGAVCETLDRGDKNWDAMLILRPLIWSIPESPRAVTTLSNYLAQPTNTFLFGSIYADDRWATVPQLLPLLAEWLKKPDAVHDLARGLANAGTNAAFAVPLLVQAAEKGVAGEPPNFSFRVSYSGTFDPLLMNRGSAIQALAKIGVTNAAVVAVLQKAAESGDEELSAIAYVAALELGIPIEGAIAKWSNDWKLFEGFQESRFRARQKIERIGELGVLARPAVPLLKRIAAGEGMQSAARFDHFDQGAVDQLRITAITSLRHIAPEEAAPFLPFLLEHFSVWPAPETLRKWKSERDRIVPVISKQLADPKHRSVSAYILMGVDPTLPEPRKILYDALESPERSQREIAVNWLWRLTGDVPRLLPVARALLVESSKDDAQSALNALEMMGEAARPAVPDLKPLLNSEHWGTRERAGRLLRKLAPAEMPPIID